MTIDQNQTPTGEELTQTAVETAVASDQPAVTEPVAELTTPETQAANDESSESFLHTPEVAETPATPEPEPVPAPVAAVEPAPVAAAPVVAAPAATTAESDAALFDSYMSGELQIDVDGGETGFKRLSKGDRIEATIIQVEKDKVFVDLGTKAEGIIPLGELSEQNLETAKGHFNVGDKIHVIVLRPEGAEGNPIVSKKKADFESTWDTIEEAFRSETMLTANVVDRVKGGLVVDIGVRGFVPATHVGSGKLRNIEKFVGQPMQL